MTQDISRSDFVGTFVDTICCVRIVELMKFPLDSNVVFEIKGRVEAITFEFLRTVISVSDVEHGANLQISIGRCVGLAWP